MKKLILIGIACFAVGLGASTMVMLKRAPRPAPHPAADSSAKVAPADSAKLHPADSAAKDSAHAKLDTTVRHASTIPATSAATVPAVPAPVPAHPDSAPVVKLEKLRDFKAVARIFSSMKPTEAAQVLAFLSDTEVEGILRAVGPRQAADFMSNLPKERAAALSRRLLVPAPPKTDGAGQ